MAYTRLDDYFYVESIELQAGKVAYTQFGVNRFELHMLCALAGYLQLHGKRMISRKLFTDWLGMSYSLEKKSWGYIRGLISKGAVNQMGWRNQPIGTGNSLSISPFGGKILTAYGMELERLERKHKARKQLPGYNDFLVSEPDPGYNVVQLGRIS